MAKSKQFGGLDYFKIAAALLVVAIHTSPLTSVSVEADFIFTGIIARIGVPFFFMVTGYFIMPQYLFGKSADPQPLHRFVRKTLVLYGIAVAVYLPVNVYAGQFKGAGFFDIFRMLVFDGTFYHLWYLPAAILGVLLVWLLGRRFSVIHLETLLIDNSIAHYIIVCTGSVLFAVVLEKLLPRLQRRQNEKDRAWIELDRQNLQQNVTVLCKLLPSGCQFMAAVKANAYGHGAVALSKELMKLGVNDFCTAAVSEAVELRRNGVKGEILILGYTHPEQFPLLRKYRLTQTVVDYSYARILNAYGRKIKVHIKIDTGMHRLGERCERIDQINSIFNCQNLLIDGIYTHLCTADTSTHSAKAYTMAQGAAFYKVITQLKEQGYSCPKVHLLSSCGLFNYSELSGDYARIGIALYGVLSERAGTEHCPVKLRPVLSLKARVASVKDLYKGEAAGYGLQYIAKKDMKIAVLAIGYADGIPRALSEGGGKVLLNGKEALIIGRICMDQMLVDISRIPETKSGDAAVIIGKSGASEIMAYELAEQTGTITNEVLSRLGSRLNRIWV